MPLVPQGVVSSFGKAMLLPLISTLSVSGITDDFRSVLLPEHGHINLTEAQASVFESLWSFKGEPMRAERIMERAQLSSDKPIDVFKVKSRDKGKPGADLPLIAYRKLVNTQKRQGLYAMPCATG
jgi:hypothetical protein